MTPDADDTVKATVVVSAEVGAPPAWGAGLPVSPYSVVNVATGNVLTAIPITGCDPVGPPLALSLFHNSRGTPPSATPSWGFDLGGGWSISYGSHIEGASGDALVTVVGADGTRVVYSWDGTQYEPPAGIYDLLEWHPAAGQDPAKWTLRSPDQTVAEFDSQGRLVRVLDSAGNALTVEYSEGRIACIKSAADGLFNPQNEPIEHCITFAYDDEYDQLATITDPGGREWTLEYDAAGRLRKVHFPSDTYVPDSCIEFTYTNHLLDRYALQTITSRDGKTHTYTYTSGRLTHVEDPEYTPPGQQNHIHYEQGITYPTAPSESVWTTAYVDRRGKTWQFAVDGAGNLARIINPLARTWYRSFDAQHNVIETVDPLYNTWTYTYGPVGNVTSATSPLYDANDERIQTWNLTWTAPGTAEPANLYRLEQVTDPLSHWVEYAYEDATDPTAVTSITQQRANPGDPADIVTTIEYYGSEALNARGQRKLVTDANGVQHLVTYDESGYTKTEKEGLLPGEGRTSVYPGVFGPLGHNLLGWTIQGAANGEHCALIRYNVNGSAQTVECCYRWEREIPCCIEADPDDNGPQVLGNAPQPTGALESPTGCLSTATYDLAGRPTNLGGCLNIPLAGQRTSFSRDETIGYDGLGRPNAHTLSTDEMGGTADLVRSSSCTYDPDDRVLTVTGPDGQVDTYEYDNAGQLASITRGDLKLAYHYDAAGRLYQVDQLDGQVVMAKTVRHYDEASRVLWIEHRGAANLLLLRIDYEWNLDNTIAERTESDYTVSPATTTVVTFEYDACQRLVYEAREVQGTPGTPVYAFEYYYDPLGNRTQKLDLLNELTTNYVYDTDYSDPENQLDFPTRNNRLLSYSVYGPGPSGSVLLRTVTYSYYRATGNVSNITVKDECDGCDEYRDLKLVYTSNGKLWLAVWGNWELGQQDYAVTDIWEFRYAGGRQRYWARQWVAQNGSPNPGNWVPAEGAQWTDYAGEEPRLDSSLALDDGTPIATPTARYLAGAGLHTRETVSSGAIQRLHGDAVGSTVLTTDEDGQTAQKAAYTAFGEYVSPAGAVGGELPAGYPRYGYAGAHGYESGLLTLAGANPNLPPITLQHVGERWYDPGLGRFIQRDPIGLAGGLNVYLYCGANPLTGVDPDGLQQVATPWGPSTPVSVPLRFPALPPDTHGEDMAYDLPSAPRSFREAAWRCLANFGILGSPGSYEFDDSRRPGLCDYGCPFGRCTGHLVPGPSLTPRKPVPAAPPRPVAPPVPRWHNGPCRRGNALID